MAKNKKPGADKKTAKKKSVSVKKSKPAAKKSVARKPVPKENKILKKQSAKPVKAAAKKTAVKKPAKVVEKKEDLVKEAKKEVKKPIVAEKRTPPVISMQQPSEKPALKVGVPRRVARKLDTRTRYGDKELDEFRQIILEKLEAAKKELKYLQDQINRIGDNGTDDTENKFASVDDGTSSMEREYIIQMAARQRLYIDHLDKALIRIKNKTYGICRVTGKLIEKERLRAVPHATLSMEAKMSQSHSAIPSTTQQ